MSGERAAIYVRQSLARDGDDLAVTRQLQECQRLAKERRYKVLHVLEDNNRSATTGKRPAYQQLMQLIESKSIDVVVVLRHDRLLRRLTELEALIELSERTGVVVATVFGDLDLTNSTGRLLGRILASVARAEVETKSERHKLANAQKAVQGLPHGSRRPYGYRDDLVSIHEPEAAVLREMARRVIAGHSYKEVAYWLNESGHRTTQQNLWFPITVRNMLAKKRYGAIREYEGVEYPAVWEPVFDPLTWERLQLVMRLGRESYAGRPVARKYLLTGFVYCGKCGMALNGATKRDNPSRPLRRTYHCRVQGDTQRGRGCGGVVRNADALEHFIRECVVTRLDTPSLGSLLANGGDQGQLRELLTQRDSQQLRLDALVDDYATGVLSRTQFTRAKNAAQTELERMGQEIGRLNRTMQISDVPLGMTLREMWDQSDSDQWRRSILSLLVKRIVLNPGITKPYYRVGEKVMRFDPSLVDIEWIA
jgi:site-specific DNA recombinase